MRTKIFPIKINHISIQISIISFNTPNKNIWKKEKKRYALLMSKRRKLKPQSHYSDNQSPTSGNHLIRGGLEERKKRYGFTGMSLSETVALGEFAKGNFFEYRRNCTPNEHHVGTLFRTFKSYPFNFNCRLCTSRTDFCQWQTPRPQGKQFVWLLQTYLLRFHIIFLLFD